MEDSLGQYDLIGSFSELIIVLILVVMEDSLGLKQWKKVRKEWNSLNPCCNGR